MSFFLAPFVGAGTRQDPFKPAGSNRIESYIDLRPDASKAAGFALLESTDASIPGGLILGESMKDVVSPQLRGSIARFLDIPSPGNNTLEELFIALLFTPPVGKWKRVLADSKQQLRVSMGSWKFNMQEVNAVDVSDTFARGAGVYTTDLGPNWDELVGNWDIFDNRLSIVGPNGDINFTRHKTPLNGGNAKQYSIVNYASIDAGANTHAGVAVRMDGAATATNVSAYVGYAGTGNNVGLYKLVNGTFTELTNVPVLDAAPPGYLDLTVDGSLLSLKYKGSVRTTATDTSLPLSFNRVGIVEFSTGSRLNDWYGGDVPYFISPASIPSAEAFGDAALSLAAVKPAAQTISPPSIISAETFGTVTLTGSAVTRPDWYPNGAPPNLPRATVIQMFKDIYTRVKQYTFTQTGMPSGMAPGAWRVQVPDQTYKGQSNHTFSEGIAYGMILCAHAMEFGSPIYDPDARGYFDGFNTYRKHFSRNGFMDWRVQNNGTVDLTDYSTGGATDGDEDMAFALQKAHAIFPNAGYGAEASQLMNSMKAFEFLPGNHPQYPYLITNGNQWGFEDNHLMLDYSRPGMYRDFARHNKDPEWNQIAGANYRVYNFFNNNFTSGMIRENCDREGNELSPLKQSQGFGPKWSYNGIRYPVSIAYDFLVNGGVAPTVAPTILRKLVAYGKNQSNGNIANLRAEYSVDGTQFASYTNIAFVQAFGAAALTRIEDADFAAQCLTFMHNGRFENSYFGLTLSALSALLMTGLYGFNGTTAPTTAPPAQILLLSSVPNEDAVGTPTVSVSSITDLYTANYSGTYSGTNAKTVVLNSIIDEDGFGVPVVVPKLRAITVLSIDSQEAVSIPVVTSPRSVAFASILTNEAFGLASIRGALRVIVQGIVSQEFVSAPLSVGGKATIYIDSIDPVLTLGTPFIKYDNVAVMPVGIVSEERVGSFLVAANLGNGWLDVDSGNPSIWVLDP